MNKDMAPKLPNLPCFEALGVIFCPDVCSYFCLVCGGWGSLAYLREMAIANANANAAMRCLMCPQLGPHKVRHEPEDRARC